MRNKKGLVHNESKVKTSTEPIYVKSDLGTQEE